jgi:tRNA G18 (ribose-2'-O)-methylase SpoU
MNAHIASPRQITYDERRVIMHTKDVVVVVETLNDPGNIGMIFRLSDNFGIRKIYMVGHMLQHLTTKVHRASRNTHKYIDHEFNADTVGVLKKLREDGYHIVAIELATNSLPLNEMTFKHLDKVVVIMGSEEKGMSTEALALAHVVLHIPMMGMSHSMNVATATSVALYSVVNS